MNAIGSRQLQTMNTWPNMASQKEKIKKNNNQNFKYLMLNQAMMIIMKYN